MKLRDRREILGFVIPAAILLVVTAGIRTVWARPRDAKRAGEGLTIDPLRGEVSFPAVVQPKAMDRPLGVKGHHAVVFREGRAATWALFRSEVSDLEVRRALEKLGARAGENLTEETWTRRNDMTSRDADLVVDGTAIEAFVAIGNKRLPLASLIREGQSPSATLDLRYGGNERFRETFRSGCIICLYSCPGGAIGNRAYTIRDYVRDGVIFHARENQLPRAGSRVQIILKPKLEVE